VPTERFNIDPLCYPTLCVRTMPLAAELDEQCAQYTRDLWQYECRNSILERTMAEGKSCSKCASTELLTATVFGNGEPGSLLPLGMLHGPKYENQICAACGYTEWYVAKDSLYLVRDKLNKAK
jgi:predicted nucleic-acid-binding Zn-ribbon protein